MQTDSRRYIQTNTQPDKYTDRQNRQRDRHKNRQHNLVLINVVNNVIGLCKELQNWRSPMSPSSERIEGFWVVCVWKTDWLTNWLTEWPPDWLAYWMIDWLTDWLTNWLTDWLADWLTSQTNPLTDRQNRQIDRHTNNKQHNLVLINGVNNVIGHSKEFQVDLRPLAPR